MRRKVFSREHPMTLTALANVARVSLQVGEAKQALPLAEGAAKLADRVYADAPNGRHASTFVTLAETRLANGDAAGAVAAMQRADTLLARLDEPVPSVAAYLQKVRARLCAAAAISAGCAAPASPATSARVQSD